MPSGRLALALATKPTCKNAPTIQYVLVVYLPATTRSQATRAEASFHFRSYNLALALAGEHEV
jgi:hypothetical protein